MRLPPLSTVRPFEAAARHLSVTRAAAELHVTPGAVSQQLRNLEAFLGCALFERQPRGLALTPAGASYREACQSALATLGRATDRLLASESTVVVISCTSTFAMQWLLPRLPSWQAGQPGFELRISTSNRLVDLHRESVHFAVRHGLGDYPGLQADRLLDDELVPVCAPRLLAPRKTAGARDLRGPLLLHDEHREDWRMWLAAAQREDVDWREGPVFTDSNGAVEAALSAKGFALVRRSLVAAELADGRLLLLKAPALQRPIAYHLVYRTETLVDAPCRAFHAWLLAQCAGAR